MSVSTFGCVKFRLPSASQVVPRPRIDQSGNSSRVVTRPPINHKPRFLKTPPVQPADLNQPPAPPPPGSRMKGEGPGAKPLQQPSQPSSWSSSPVSSKDKEAQRAPFQRLTPGRPNSPASEASKKREKPKHQPFQRMTPSNEVGVITSAASDNGYLEPAAQPFEPFRSKSAETSKKVLGGAGPFPAC